MSARTSAADVPTMELGPISANPLRVASVPSFHTIYQGYFDFVWTSARSMRVGSDAIDDVVQDVFIVIHARLHTLKDPTALRSWIYGIVRRTVFAQYRTQRARITTHLDEADDSIGSASLPTPAEIADQSDQVKLLWRLLERLDEPKREIFVMAELAEMTMPEIAQALDIPVGTASTRLRAARKAFAVALARHKANPRRGDES